MSKTVSSQWKSRCLSLAFSVAATITLGAPAWAQDYDLVILNGRVMDPESNFDGVKNVGIKDGKIVAITADAITGTETIDASGHVVSPVLVA